MPRYRVTISGQGYDAMADLVREHSVDIHRPTLRQPDAENRYSVDAIVDDNQIHALEAKGYTIERHEDVDEAGKERQKEIG